VNSKPLPPLPEALIVRRNAHGFTHSYTALQMGKYGQDCAEADQAEVTRLTGEAKVLRDLLALTLEPLDTVEAESTEEGEALHELTQKIRMALGEPTSMLGDAQ
jgi:hypothetical protein